MDLKKVIGICKKSKEFWVSNEEYQILSDGIGYYLLSEDIPFLTSDVISALYDIDKDKMESNYLYKSFTAFSTMYEDTYADEETIQPLAFGLSYEGKELVLFKTSDGLVLLDSSYLKPLGVQFSELQFTLRDNEWIAIKTGMFVTAIITAFDCNRDDDFFEVIKQLYKLNSVSRENEFMKNKNFDEMEGVNDVCDN